MFPARISCAVTSVRIIAPCSILRNTGIFFPSRRNAKRSKHGATSHLTTGARLFLNRSRDTKKVICIFFHLNTFIRRHCHYVTQFHRSARKIGETPRARERKENAETSTKKCQTSRAGPFSSKQSGQAIPGTLFLHHCHYPVSNNSETISLSLTFFS